MANAKHDENGVPTATVVLQGGGANIVRLAVNPTTHRLRISDASTGSDTGPELPPHDENHVPTLSGVADTDLSTIVVIHGTSDGRLLVDSQ